MKIRKLQLKNIGVFDDETIEFQAGPEGKAEIHILTGENGTGKTTILQAFVSAFGFQGKLRNSFEKRFRKSTPNSDLFLVEISFEVGKNNNLPLKTKTQIKTQIKENPAISFRIEAMRLPGRLTKVRKSIFGF